jgi:hypothetical protein
MVTLAVDAELREHEESYAVFRRIVLYALMHIAFTVVCLALAFLGGASVLSGVLWIGGTLAMLGMYMMRTGRS